MVAYLWSHIGLIMNFLGSLLVAVSFGKHIAGGHNLDARGRRIYLASFLHPWLFRLGLALMSSGFIIEMLKPE